MACASSNYGLTKNLATEIVEWSKAQDDYLSKPNLGNSENLPAIILMHGCGGLGRAVLDGLKSHSHFFNSHGYVTFIVDSFSLRGKGNGLVCDSFDELASARDYRREDARQALKLLKSLDYVDSNNVFLIGQSNGGSVALFAAGAAGISGFRAVAAYYPWCGNLPSILSTPLLVLGAEKDDWVSPQICEVMASKGLGADFKTVVYKNAQHSFDLDIKKQEYSGRWVGGDSLALIQSRIEILNWFEKFKVQ